MAKVVSVGELRAALSRSEKISQARERQAVSKAVEIPKGGKGPIPSFKMTKSMMAPASDPPGYKYSEFQTAAFDCASATPPGTMNW